MELQICNLVPGFFSICVISQSLGPFAPPNRVADIAKGKNVEEIIAKSKNWKLIS
jgi:hypothetical protein